MEITTPPIGSFLYVVTNHPEATGVTNAYFHAIGKLLMIEM